MCGRFAVDIHIGVIEEVFDLAPGEDEALELSPTWNAVPGTDQTLVVADTDELRTLATARWGLMPHWAKDPAMANRLVNARAETVATKPAFRDGFARSRCLIPATGYYEWDSVTGARDPYFYVVDEGAPFALAGIRSQWRAPDGRTLDTFCMLTTEPNELTAAVHDRMPVIIDRADYTIWLSPLVRGGDELERTLRPFDPTRMTSWTVSRRVNRPENDGPELILPQAPQQGRLF